MTDKITPTSNKILAQFRAASFLFHPKSRTVLSDQDFSETKILPKSCAQVETLVTPQAVTPKSGELKLDGIIQPTDDNRPVTKKDRRPNPLTVRLSDRERKIIENKAKNSGCSVNSYVKASVLGSDYRPPTDPGLIKALLKLNRELTAQGNNLNQIARHMNSGQVSPFEGNSLLGIIARSMLQTHKAVRNALTRDSDPETGQ